MKVFHEMYSSNRHGPGDGDGHGQGQGHGHGAIWVSGHPRMKSPADFPVWRDRRTERSGSHSLTRAVVVWPRATCPCKPVVAWSAALTRVLPTGLQYANPSPKRQRGIRTRRQYRRSPHEEVIRWLGAATWPHTQSGRDGGYERCMKCFVRDGFSSWRSSSVPAARRRLRP